MDEDSLDDVEPAIFRLPPEIMLLIFSHCSGWELVSLIPRVCTRWNELVISERFWRHRALHLKGRNLAQYFWKLVRSVGFLTSLSLENCTGCSDLISMLSKRCHLLSTLKIDACAPLDLENLNKLNTLVEVDICINWQDYQHKVMFELPAISTISTVVLRRFFFKDYLAVHLIEKCHNLHTLIVTKLDRVEEYIPKRRNHSHANNEKGLSCSLQTVYIFGEQYLSRELLRSIGRIKTLFHIVLKPTNYSKDELVTFLFSVPMHFLVTLDLGYALSISDSLLKSVTCCCPNLKNLVLTRCDVGDDALKFIMNSLSKIEKLNLHGTHVTSARFHELPQCLPNLTDLKLLACRRVRHDHLFDLVLKLPNLLVELPRHGLLTGCKVIGRTSPFLSFRNQIK